MDPPGPAVDHLRQARAAFRHFGHRSGEAPALAHLGILYNRLGQPEQAFEHHSQALTLFRQIGVSAVAGPASTACVASVCRPLPTAALMQGPSTEPNTRILGALPWSPDFGRRARWSSTIHQQIDPPSRSTLTPAVRRTPVHR
ncbi:tetratricopeptide repeat protein [Plantactinospora sp. KLBMP9567]|uniref:tetratricopeptide repeat protein n=1 Tax=Plantactinospora sp. KLBMP9567 TaxID=3085900 RepID=UPI003990AA37